MMFLDLPDNLLESIIKIYEQAIDDGILKFNGDTAVNLTLNEKVNDSTFDFQLTCLSSLMHRPEKGAMKFNPFANPEPELTILEDYGSENQFRLVFNKYPVVPYHFMLLTKEFMSQNSPLYPSELIAIYSVLHNLKKNDKEKRWFAFYNCGEESGASQPHKHVQFMSLPDGFTSVADRLISKSESFLPSTTREPLQNADAPFAHFVAKLPDDANDMTEDDLSMFFSSLLQRTLTVIRENSATSASFNVIMTTEYMMLVPRSKSKYEDIVGINSCGALGLFLCPSEETFGICKEVGPLNILREVGFPNTAGESTDEYHY